jgi:hypothetical protein
MQEAFVNAKHAYETLTNRTLRLQYDASLDKVRIRGQRMACQLHPSLHAALVTSDTTAHARSAADTLHGMQHLPLNTQPPSMQAHDTHMLSQHGGSAQHLTEWW